MGDGMGNAGLKHEFRWRLFLQQDGRCFWCWGRMSFGRTKNGSPARDFATFEHLVPRQVGGQINGTNIVLAHRKCNTRRNAFMQAARSNSVGQNVAEEK